MGTRHDGTLLDRGNGIDLWGHAMGVLHWLDGGGGGGLSYGGVPWGRATGSGRWN